jgi:hypothetical protein
MPHVGGRALAAVIRRLRRQVPIVFMSVGAVRCSSGPVERKRNVRPHRTSFTGDSQRPPLTNHAQWPLLRYAEKGHAELG